MYEYVGKASPFLVLATLGLFDGCMFVIFSTKKASYLFLIHSITINGPKTWCFR